MRALPFLLLALAPLALAPSADAGGCVPSTKEPEVTAPLLLTTYYVDYDYDPEYSSWWVYEESNGIAGLQRADVNHDDTCGGEIPADTIVL